MMGRMLAAGDAALAVEVMMASTRKGRSLLLSRRLLTRALLAQKIRTGSWFRANWNSAIVPPTNQSSVVFTEVGMMVRGALPRLGRVAIDWTEIEYVVFSGTPTVGTPLGHENDRRHADSAVTLMRTWLGSGGWVAASSQRRVP